MNTTTDEMFVVQPRRRFFNVDSAIIAVFVACADAVTLFSAGYFLYVYEPFNKGENFSVQLSSMALYPIMAVLLLQAIQLYKVEAIIEKRASLSKLTFLSIINLSFFIAILFAFDITHAITREWAVYWLFTSSIGIWLVHLISGQCLEVMTRYGWLARNIAIVGASAQGALLIDQLKKTTYPWLKVVGVFDDRSARISQDLDKKMIRGSLDNLIAMVRTGHVDEIYVALPWSAVDRVSAIIERLRVIPVSIRLCPESICYKFNDKSYSYSHGIPLLNMLDKPLAGWNCVIKNLEDKIIGSIILLLISPILAVIALLVKLDSPGPVFFRQKRYGFNNQLIDVYKFRTMYSDRLDNNASQLTERNDSRVTKLGRFLRKTSLDELPQFINVMKGEMSIVGPRPHAMQAKAAGMLYEEVVDQYAARHNVKPGITGLAQVNGWRGNTDTEEKIQKRVDCDIEYIDNWSLFLDMKIIVKTIFVVLVGENAY